MNGPEHYRAAELLLAEADHIHENGGDMGRMIAAAQVHATLAQVAAYALTQRIADAEDASGYPSQEHYDEWVQVVEIGGKANSRAQALREAADEIDTTDLPQDHADMFDNGARWATSELRRMAKEAESRG